jgi:hypothetical protein
MWRMNLKKTTDVTEKLCVVHLPNESQVVRTFLDVKTALDFAEKFEEENGIKLSCDPLYMLIHNAQVEGYWKGIKQGRKER